VSDERRAGEHAAEQQASGEQGERRAERAAARGGERRAERAAARGERAERAAGRAHGESGIGGRAATKCPNFGWD
jgi:hypothetical protein